MTDQLILTQLPDLSPVENKEYKPGPIGKERSLKNRKVKDAQQGEPEGQEKPSPTSVRSPEPVTTKETKAASELSTEIGTMISVSAPEFGTNTKVRKILYVKWDSSEVVDTCLPAGGAWTAEPTEWQIGNIGTA